MDWIEGKSIRGLRTEFGEVFVGREAFEGFESSGEIVGFREVCQVRFEWMVGVLEESFHRGIFNGPVHAFELPVGPGVVWLLQPVFDSVKPTELVEGMTAEACGWSWQFLGRPANCIPLSVSTVWMRYEDSLDQSFKEK